MIIKASEYGITPEQDITTALNEAIEKLREIEGEKVLAFDKGEYFLNSDNAVNIDLYITNTMAKSEWKRGEKHNANKVGVLIDRVKDLTLDFGGSTLTVEGQLTNFALLNSHNIAIKNLKIRTISPDMHELKVTKRGFNYIDYLLDSETHCEIKRGKAYFVGKDYRSDIYHRRTTAYWIGKIPRDSIDSFSRVSHPMNGAVRVKEIDARTLRVYYLIAPRYETGDRFYIFDNRRKFQGFFVSRSGGINLDNVEQNFNYGLAFVAQESENITIENCNFKPEENGARLMTSAADFIQICMCRGDVAVRNSNFIGAGDDALNVHGIHFKVVGIRGNSITVRFMHRQTYGFCPFKKGDIIKFVDTSSMLEIGERRTVVNARLIDNYNIEIELDKPAVSIAGAVIENISACPNLLYENNVIKRIVSRGILITTSGKVVVRNNSFIDTSMHSLLISDDANNWYESGNVSDVTIENNIFKRCVGYSVQIMPENKTHKGAVHENIHITGNTIDSNGEGGFYIKSSDNVVIKGNNIIGKTRKTYISDSNVTKDFDD